MNLIEISQQIRRVRQAQCMTLEQLAVKSGFSKGFISQVENFRQTPSLKALARIADALGVSISTLFSSDDNNLPPYSFGHIDRGEHLHRNDEELYGIKYLSLAFKQIGRHLDPFIVEYTPASPRDYLQHESEEFFVLIEGQLDYYIMEDANKHIMNAGDTLYMLGNIPHRVELHGECKYAKCLIIYSGLEI